MSSPDQQHLSQPLALHRFLMSTLIARPCVKYGLFSPHIVTPSCATADFRLALHILPTITAARGGESGSSTSQQNPLPFSSTAPRSCSYEDAFASSTAIVPHLSNNAGDLIGRTCTPQHGMVSMIQIGTLPGVVCIRNYVTCNVVCMTQETLIVAKHYFCIIPCFVYLLTCRNLVQGLSTSRNHYLHDHQKLKLHPF
ncbi:unnamed protein product [Periconia digitata]|uniref:Uncharacterized protein n=1 Tax=Periconia digitata TaxID=1303443 RepID=A0A9W4XTE1_9PLEO|nr:unnamed protein product [Periconia digitata]